METEHLQAITKKVQITKPLQNGKKKVTADSSYE